MGKWPTEHPNLKHCLWPVAVLGLGRVAGRPRSTHSTSLPTEDWSLPVSRHTVTFFASGLPSQKNPALPLFVMLMQICGAQ